MIQGVKLLCQLAQLEWDSPRVRQRTVETSPPPLSHGQYQAPPIWKEDSTGIHVLTELLQVPSHCPMVERGEVEPHFGLGRSDPPAQLEKRH